jgi:hypothetical protein
MNTNQRVAADETRARVEAAGLPTHRTEDEWAEHPTAIDDLLRVMSGTRHRVIDAERRLERDLHFPNPRRDGNEPQEG